MLQACKEMGGIQVYKTEAEAENSRITITQSPG